MARGIMAEWAAQERAELEAEGKGQKVGSLFIVRQSSTNPKHPVHVRIWQGKQSKPFYNYVMSEQRADNEIARLIQQDKEREAYVAKRKDEDKARKLEAQAALTVGTLLHGSWGYDQTNCELYQIVGRPSANKVEVRAVGYVVSDVVSHGMAEHRRAKKDDLHGPVLTLTIGAGGNVKLHEHCYLSPTDEQQKHYASWYA